MMLLRTQVSEGPEARLRPATARGRGGALLVWAAPRPGGRCPGQHRSGRRCSHDGVAVEAEQSDPGGAAWAPRRL